MDNWYEIKNVQQLDTPALAVYYERVLDNIRSLKKIQPDPELLRPHVKTSKISEVQQLLMNEGIRHFKCSTIAEAEMLAMLNAEDVLLAYQPTGPKINRLLELSIKYPDTVFACLIDNETTANDLSNAFTKAKKRIRVWIDLNTGMNRTGIVPEEAERVIDYCKNLSGIEISGLHIYDGHITDTDYLERKQKSDESFSGVDQVYQYLKNIEGKDVGIIAGGSPTFPIHAKKENIQCSPGTFIFWDWGYANLFPDLNFQWAALIVTRVVSIVSKDLLCLDVGYKALASEKPLPRIHFLNEVSAVPVSQSEEHLVVKIENADKYKPGDVWYGVPVHVCPTVALYDRAAVIMENKISTYWTVVARNRAINI